LLLIVPTGAATNVTVLSHNGYLDSYGLYHIIGEVQNVGDQAVNMVKITATFYDSKGVAITTRLALTMLFVLTVGEKSPFDIVLSDASQSASVSRYDLSVASSSTSSIPVGLEISAYNSYTDESGSMHLAGEIKNIGTENATSIKVVATCYDETGNVTAAALVYLDQEQPIELAPGQTTQFDISIGEDRTPYIASYELTAESTEYTGIPEFPILILTLLAFLMLLIAALILRKYSVREVSAHPTKRRVQVQMSASSCTHT
jgi:hypothetical protein